jgi:PAS domain S-box-containing protein
MEGTLAAINLSFISVEMDSTGSIKNINKNFVEATGLTLKDLEKTTFDKLFLSKEDSAFWQEVLQHKNCNEEFSLKGKEDKEIWVRGIFTTIKNRKDANEKILLLGYDVTEEKLSSIKLEASFEQTRKQTEQLKDQEEEMQANMEVLQIAVRQSEEKADSLKQLLQQKEEEIKALQASQKTKTNSKKSTSNKKG